jgi:hypothetical protein
VIQTVDDLQLVTYDAADWRAEQLSVECDTSYSRILNALHAGFNGKPDKVSDAVGAMFEFETIAGELLQQKLPPARRPANLPDRDFDTWYRANELG